MIVYSYICTMLQCRLFVAMFNYSLNSNYRNSLACGNAETLAITDVEGFCIVYMWDDVRNAEAAGRCCGHVARGLVHTIAKNRGERQGAAKRIKEILKYKKITQEEFSHIVFPEKPTASAQFRNLLACDTLRFNTVEEWLDQLGYDIVFVDRKTRKQFKP